MTSGPVPFADLAKYRLLPFTAFLAKRTTGVERATTWGIHGAGNVTSQHNSLTFSLHDWIRTGTRRLTSTRRGVEYVIW